MAGEQDAIEFDVAISFRNSDLPRALQLADMLKPAVKVFVYSRQQEDVAATDGLESFRTVFRRRARISVVLLREGWGKTPWTGVEEIAIRDRCLQTKYKNLIVVRLDDSAAPDWIPDTHIHFDLQKYSMAELVGIIKARAVECGTDLQTPSLADRADSIKRRREFELETKAILERSSLEFNKAFELLKQEIRSQVENVVGRTGWKFECGEPAAVIGGFILSAEGRSLQIVTSELYVNTARSACLYAREYAIGIPVAQPGMMYHAWEVNILRSEKIEIQRTPEMSWCWHLQNKTLSVRDAAEELIGQLLQSIASSHEK